MKFFEQTLSLVSKWLTKIRTLSNGTKLLVPEILFIFFCFMPFIIPNPIVKTDIQPYAALLGTIILLQYIFVNYKLLLSKACWLQFVKSKPFLFASICTLIVAIIVLFFSQISLNSLRALYNYYAIAIIPCACAIIFKRLRAFPESLIKCLIFIWFIVAAIQLFIYRGFMTFIVSGARWDSDWRGVIGLASEPSFLGIICFYFLHLIRNFKKNQLLYTILVLFTGLACAQSAMGIMFIVPFFIVYLLDTNKKIFGVSPWAIMLAVLVIFLIVLNTVLAGSRLQNLFLSFVRGGIGGLLNDPSVQIRFGSIVNALRAAFQNFLLPLGYGDRIGSGFGGILCELGFLSLPILIGIPWAMSLTFTKKSSRIIYAIVVFLLLLNNTQIGNPLLLFVIGSNLTFQNTPAIKGESATVVLSKLIQTVKRLFCRKAS